MSTHLEPINCLLCGKTVFSYQEFQIHVQSYPINEMKVDVIEGSNILSVPLPRPSKSLQHVRTLESKRVN